MKYKSFQIISIVVLLNCWSIVRAAERAVEIPTALLDYVDRPDSAFAWKLGNEQKLKSGFIYEIDLVSQEWQGITWKHSLYIYEPKEVQFPRHVLLFVTGGSNGRKPGRESIDFGLKLAQLSGARVATLHQVPNQPLLGGRKEDDLITETWLRFLKTGDAKWPLLFPMVKSTVKAMDAIEAFAKSRWNQPVDGFVITGASKRGWTSWLAPVADKRIIATAPMVIDVLNFRPQMQHQLDTWGEYSEQIIDYSSKGLIKFENETPRDVQLRRMMDPYTYLKRLDLPKLLINGTNDRYWVVDAMKHYWYELDGPKYVLQVPNAGHSLKGGREAAFTTLAAYFRQIARGTPLPTIQWEHSTDGGADLRLSIRSSLPAKVARLWSAHSETKDFRAATWQSQPLRMTGEEYVGRLSKPKRGHIALYGDLQFECDDLRYSLSTVIRRE